KFQEEIKICTDEIYDELNRFINESGYWVYQCKEQWREFLVSLCGEYEKEVFLLAKSVQAGVPDEILQTGFDSPSIERRINKVRPRLINEYNLSKECAWWIMKLWGLVYDVISNKNLNLLNDYLTKSN
ncbi:MAG: hypothetical protein ACQEP9_10190, partial [Bacillota bacterium]